MCRWVAWALVLGLNGGCVESQSEEPTPGGGADDFRDLRESDVLPTIEQFLVTQYNVSRDRIQFGLPLVLGNRYELRGTVITPDRRLAQFRIDVTEERNSAGQPSVREIEALTTDDDVHRYNQPSLTHYGCTLLRSIPNITVGSLCIYNDSRSSVEIAVSDGEPTGPQQTAQFNALGQLTGLRLHRVNVVRP